MRATHLRRDRVAEADLVVGKGRLGRQEDRHPRSTRDRAPSGPPDLPRLEGEGETEVAGRRGDARAPRDLMPLLVAVRRGRPRCFLTHDALSGQALQGDAAGALRRRPSGGCRRARPHARPDLAQDRAPRPPRRRPRRSRHRGGSSGLVPGVRRALPRAALTTRTRSTWESGSRSGCRPLTPASGRAPARALGPGIPSRWPERG